MSHRDRANPGVEAENCGLREANAKAKKLLGKTIKRLLVTIDDKPIMEETPIEVWAAIDCALEAMRAALRCLASADHTDRLAAARLSGRPTRQQGQFLAFIREYMMRNEARVAPTHAVLQQFFNLTAPSVNSMLIRLEKRGFIRRVPGKARAIELTISTERIPQLDRPFKVRYVR
jgi:DNA-binding MarR family transcriptional regulator